MYQVSGSVVLTARIEKPSKGEKMQREVRSGKF